MARSALVHKRKVKGGTSWEEGPGQDLRAEPRDMWGSFKSEGQVISSESESSENKDSTTKSDPSHK